MAALERIKKTIPTLVMVITGIFWMSLIRQSYTEQIVTPGEVNKEVVIQYYDREMRLMEAANRGNAFEQWLSGADEEKEWLEDSIKTIQETYRQDLGTTSKDLLAAMELRLVGRDAIEKMGDDPDFRKEYRDWLIAGNGHAWNFELFLNSARDPEVQALYERENNVLLQRSWISGISYFSIIGMGFGCMLLWIFGKRNVPPRVSRIPDAWPVPWLLGLFFLADILLIPWASVVGMGYDAYYFIGGTSDIYFLYDLLWRAFPAAFLTVLFLKYPGHIIRVFGLSRPVNWILVFAGLSASALLDWGLFRLAPAGDIDPTDFMENASLDGSQLTTLLLSSVIIAPVFEEIVFRGFLFQGLRAKTGAIWAALISSVFFALIHTQYDTWGCASVAAMGLIACYLTQRTGSLKSSMVLHGLGNLMITLDVYYQYQLPI